MQHVLDSHRWIPLPPVTLGRGTSSLDHAPDDVAPPYSIMEHPPLAAFVNGAFWPYFLSTMHVNLLSDSLYPFILHFFSSTVWGFTVGHSGNSYLLDWNCEECNLCIRL